MATIPQGVIVEHLPQSPITYGTSAHGFSFVLSFGAGLECEESNPWLTIIDSQLFCVPQLGNQCAFVTTWGHQANYVPVVGNLATENAMAGLRAVVGAIREARPLPTTPGLDELLTRAINAHGIPDNISEWASRLAEDVGTLTD